jgi:hypothetical protein
MRLQEGNIIDSECINITVSGICAVKESININFNAILTAPFVISQKVTKKRSHSQTHKLQDIQVK